MPGSRITWVIGGAVVALIVVASVDALRSPDDGAATSATAGVTTARFSPTTTVVTVIDDEAEGNDFVRNQAPDDVVDEGGDPLPVCSQDQLQVSIPPLHDTEGDGFFGLLLVRAVDDCRLGYPYFRVALRDSRGQQLLVWNGRLHYSTDHGPLQFALTSAHFGPVPCQSWEVFPALVTLGKEPSPEGQVFRLEAHCQATTEAG